MGVALHMTEKNDSIVGPDFFSWEDVSTEAAQ